MEGRPPERVPSDEARLELARDLLDLPELFQRQVDAVFDVKIGPSEDASAATTKMIEASVAEPTAKGYERVGIVFVHGVGSQRKGDTLREFGTPLVDWVEEWYADHAPGRFRVTWSELTPQGAEPAAAGLIIPKWKDDTTEEVHAGQVWVLTEAWWAPRVEPPPLKTMVVWARARVWRLFRGLMAGAAAAATVPLSASGKQAWIERFFQFVNALGILVVYGAAQVLLSFLLLILLAAALVPIPGLERLILIRVARPLLTNNVGDFHVCLYDRLQAVHVRQSLFEAVNWLVRTMACDRVVVAAHSGGTVVATDALGTSDVLGVGIGPRALPEHLKKVKTLITFGAALNAAWDEYTYSARLSADKPAREIPKRLRNDGPGGTTWLNFWTRFDWALPGRGLDHGSAKEGERLFSLPVTNGLSPLTDHGGYLSNYEEFISRLAQEADSPSTPQNGTEYQRSRFFPGQVVEAERVVLRYERVSMLTRWRFFTVCAVVGALAARYWFGGQDAVADAAAIAGLIPLVGGALGSASGLVLRTLLVLAVAAVMAAAYGLWVELFFADWHTTMSRRSARRRAPHQTGSMARRTVGFVLLLVVLVVAFALAPPFATIRQAVGLPA